MRHYCTLFDINYLARGLALIASLERHSPPFTLHILCLDESTHRYFTSHPSPRIRAISLAELEAGDAELLRAKENRSRIEYYFTLSPTLPLRLLHWHPEIDQITYLDADLYFFSDPEPIFSEMGNRSILIIGHRFPSHLNERERYGIYNVGFLSFRRDANGLSCLEWWRERCNQWCYDLVEADRFADQKYLDHWPEKFPGVCVLRQAGAGLAPWNLLGYTITANRSGLRIDGDPLIFYHFHNFGLIARWLVDPGISFYWNCPIPQLILKELFLPYLLELRRILRKEPAAKNIVLPRYKSRFSHPLVNLSLPPPKLLYFAQQLRPVPTILTVLFWQIAMQSSKRVITRCFRKSFNFLAAPFRRISRKS